MIGLGGRLEKPEGQFMMYVSGLYATPTAFAARHFNCRRTRLFPSDPSPLRFPAAKIRVRLAFDVFRLPRGHTCSGTKRTDAVKVRGGSGKLSRAPLASFFNPVASLGVGTSSFCEMRAFLRAELLKPVVGRETRVARHAFAEGRVGHNISPAVCEVARLTAKALRVLGDLVRKAFNWTAAAKTVGLHSVACLSGDSAFAFVPWLAGEHRLARGGTVSFATARIGWKDEATGSTRSNYSFHAGIIPCIEPNAIYFAIAKRRIEAELAQGVLPFAEPESELRTVQPALFDERPDE